MACTKGKSACVYETYIYDILLEKTYYIMFVKRAGENNCKENEVPYSP